MSEIIEQLRAEVATTLGIAPEEVDNEAVLSDLGIDSVRIMGLAERIIAAGYLVEYADLAADPRLISWERLVRDASRTRMG